ncbi:hypothetical protein GGS24DRAFT_478076 [Hypoxylon argillaceum]|nr:hypothetical protein GGS24DRAFT_478076 [Hypoxylon argillaceum]
MASELATESIADNVTRALAAFEAITTRETQVEPTGSQYTWVRMIDDQLSKFKLWAGNIGAHRTGRRSLDYRLRDSSHLQTQVLRLLDDLVTSLNEVHSILSGETLPWDQDLGEAGELDEELKELLMNEDFEFDSELGQLTKEVTDSIAYLLRLSMALRHPAPHDRFMSTEYANVRYFEATDKAHVEAKYPRASQYLIIRLGQALSQRRQYFKYRESHHEKLARGLIDSGRSEVDGQSTVASSIPGAMKMPGADPRFGELDEDERSDTGFSQTSFATTAPESDRLRIPPLPRRAHDGPFECPFCYMLISVSGKHQWKKHVLRDLRPYICLVEDCETGNREYSRRHEWMNHMFQKHWKSWPCPYQCGWDGTTETNLRQHVTRIHGPKTNMELDAMIARCGQIRLISASSPVVCPLCQHILESVQQYQRHVGRHQVDLALFALPRIENDDSESDEAREDQGTISTRSGSYSEAISDGISPTASPRVAGTTENNEEGDKAPQQDNNVNGHPTRQMGEPAPNIPDPSPNIAMVADQDIDDISRHSEKMELERRIKDKLDRDWPATLEEHAREMNKILDQLSEYDMALKVPTGSVIEVGNVKIHSTEGGEVNVGRTGTPQAGNDRGTSAYGDLRNVLRDQDVGKRTGIPSNLVINYPDTPNPLDVDELFNSLGIEANEDRHPFLGQNRSPKREGEAAQKEEYGLERLQKQPEEIKLDAEVEQPEQYRDGTARGKEELREDETELDATYFERKVDPLENQAQGNIGIDSLEDAEAEHLYQLRREQMAKKVVERREAANTAGVRWTKISRKKVSPEALTVGKEEFKVGDDFVIVERILSEEEVEAYATATRQLRGKQ